MKAQYVKRLRGIIFWKPSVIESGCSIACKEGQRWVEESKSQVTEGPFGLHPGDSEKLLFKDFEQGNDMINLAF